MARSTSTLILPYLLFGAALLASAASASGAALQPPRGYLAPVESRHKAAAACPEVPRPYTGKLLFTSKYAGSDQARATLNRQAEQAFRQQTAEITALEHGFNQLVRRYMRDGQPRQLDCALRWLGRWAGADALLSSQYNHTGKSIRKWTLGSLASAYLRLKFSASQPLAQRSRQTQPIEAWFAKLAEQTVQDWSGLPPRKINNHSYWAAWSVMAAAVVLDRRDLFDWSVEQFRVAANQVDQQGFLPNELKRRQRALAYHNYSLPPLAMVAAFAQANGVDLRATNDGALRRLAGRVLDGIDQPQAFARKAGSKQDLSEFRKPAKFAWLAPYCALYSCSARARALQQEHGPFSTFRLGGDVSRLFRGGVRSEE